MAQDIGIFFDGDLQSGISLALRKSKLVACFISGDDEQSSLWRGLYLADEQVATALSSVAVTLRIIAGSQEADYLSAYYPMSSIPAFILIENGTLILDFQVGATQENFKAELLKTLGSTVSSPPIIQAPTSGPSIAASSVSSNSGPSETSDSILNNRLDFGLPSGQPVSQTASEPPGPSLQEGAPSITSTNAENVENARSRAPSLTQSANTSSPAVQNLLSERRYRLEADRNVKQDAQRAEREAKAKAREEAISTARDSAKARQAKYALQQKNRQRAARSERERVLKSIELDKRDRKEQKERRKELARLETGVKDGAEGLIDQQLSTELVGLRPKISTECAVQVRLLDGSTIRSNFSIEQTLRKHVRTWIDGQRSDGDIPYTFKHILAPMPNRTLSISEEEESLLALGLTPSATLILIPVQGYTAAYIGHQGLISKGASIGYSMMSAGTEMITGAFATILGRDHVTEQGGPPGNSERSSQVKSGSSSRVPNPIINIRTLGDQQEHKEDHQLYNGNQLNFEPQRDTRHEDD